MSAPPTAEQHGRPAWGRIDAAVHFGFAVLLLTSVIRYVMRHSPADNVGVLVLAAGVAVLYTLGAIQSRHAGFRAGCMVVLLVAWSALVVLAPSFAWCSFALFFLCRAVFLGKAAYVAAGVTTLATAVGLFRLNGGTDIAMLLGPLAVGLLLTLVYDRIETDARIQRELHGEVQLAQQRLLDSERTAGALAERERVSREIHDTVTQGLASNILLLEAAVRQWPEAAAREGVQAATNLLRSNLAETRSLVHELSGPALSGQGMARDLLTAASDFVDGAELRTSGQERAVPQETFHALLRVAQSACANIKLHADATHVSLSVGYLPEAVTLDIYDDGCGFDPLDLPAPGAKGGYGLRAMRQRVTQLGGEFSVESSPGEGTIVAAVLPLPNETDHREDT
ncbi:histidine kinase [Arthrobacter sp. H35-D1]|uniref:sensor histidine kinase n=1 Tax=Arthrobacter sp. H35-D1 TaxID=3046202 RepID=UPI0024BB0645|nr:histidine kinase [Arthrobacter sp. H35-D1]MDJ0315333.1 histidine kinase [Arthrobacter sp. H35-D1]